MLGTITINGKILKVAGETEYVFSVTDSKTNITTSFPKRILKGENGVYKIEGMDCFHLTQNQEEMLEI